MNSQSQLIKYKNTLSVSDVFPSIKIPWCKYLQIYGHLTSSLRKQIVMFHQSLSQDPTNIKDGDLSNNS